MTERDADRRASPFTSFMGTALDAARAAGAAGETPVGAVVVDAKGTVLATAGNRTRADHDPTAHAEVLALRRAAAKLGSERLVDCALWVTLEPCAMCAGAIAHARIARLYYGAEDPKGGAVAHGPRLYEQPTTLWRPEVYGGVAERECADLLRAFFAARRR